MLPYYSTAAHIMKGVKLNMAMARRLPSGSWRVQASFTDYDGVKHRASFTEATAKLAETKAMMWQLGMVEADTKKQEKRLGDAMDLYIDTCRVSNRSPTTVRAYTSMRNSQFESIIEKPLKRITLMEIQKWINERSRVAAPKTIRNALNLLSAVLKENSIKLDFDLLKLPKSNREEMEIPSDEQVSALLESIYDQDDLYLAVAFAALMGLRRSELCALEWADISLVEDTPMLTVDKALVRDENGGYVVKETKTSAGTRRLVIPDAFHAELKRRRNLKTRIVDITPDGLTNRYSIRAKKHGMPTRFHNLRHYHASVMLREGVPEKYIVADMGHGSFDMVRRVYGHIMSEKRGEINDAMNAHSSQILAGAHASAHASEKTS